MRVLIRPRHDTDLAHDAFRVDLAGRAVGTRPLGDRPAPDAFLMRERHLVVFAVVVEGFLGPGLPDDLQRLLVDAAVVIVDRGTVHWRAGDMVLLTQHIDPAVLVAAGEAGIDPPLGQLIEDGDLFGRADRVPGWQDQPERREFDPLGARREIGIEEQRRDRGLVALRMEMVLGRGKDIEAGIVGEYRQLAQFVEHPLIALGIAPDRPQSLAFLQGRRHRRQHEQHELHRIALPCYGRPWPQPGLGYSCRPVCRARKLSLAPEKRRSICGLRSRMAAGRVLRAAACYTSPIPDRAQVRWKQIMW
jgi:hypothetical protein